MKNVAVVLVIYCLFLPIYFSSAALVDIAGFANATAGGYQVLAQGGPERAEEVNGFMNGMFCQYSRYFANGLPKPGARVIVFDNLPDFRAYSTASIGMIHSNLAGYCHWKTDAEGYRFYELVCFENARLWTTLAHEGFHQFLGHEIGVQAPVWLNEGLAQYFENSEVRGGRLQTGLVNPTKLLAAQNLIRAGTAPSLLELMEMDRAAFYANADVTYPMSWAAIHYLFNGEGATYRNSVFRRYLQDLKFGKDEFTSFQRRFGRDSRQWQRDFERYILRLLPQTE